MSNARNLGNITAGGAVGATTASVTTSINNLIDSSPGALNTLNELAAALGDDANFSTTVTNSIATKLNLTGGTLSGTLTVNEGGGYYANIGRGNSTPGGTDPWLGLFNNSNIAKNVTTTPIFPSSGLNNEVNSINDSLFILSRI